MADEFVIGKCYYAASDTSESPRVFLCRRSLLRGKMLVPYKGLVKLPLAGESPQGWVDCTEQVRRSEALASNPYCASVPIRQEHVGTIIAFDEGTGEMSPPHFLYAYAAGMAFLMVLDGSCRTFNMRLTHCHPLQETYVDITKRALADNPLQCSRFDGFFRWLRKTSQYSNFVAMVDAAADVDTKTDMIQLFELLAVRGVTASSFEAEVDRLYARLGCGKEEYSSKYAAVLAMQSVRGQKLSPVDEIILREADYKYTNPKEAWHALVGVRPYPTTPHQAYMEIARTHAPSPTSAATASDDALHKNIAREIGVAEVNFVDYWDKYIAPVANIKAADLTANNWAAAYNRYRATLDVSPAQRVRDSLQTNPLTCDLFAGIEDLDGAITKYWTGTVLPLLEGDTEHRDWRDNGHEVVDRFLTRLARIYEVMAYVRQCPELRVLHDCFDPVLFLDTWMCTVAPVVGQQPSDLFGDAWKEGVSLYVERAAREA